jgi:alanyl-tRNA synthetase
LGNGEQGPCGPCSEIHIDLRTDEERAVSGKSLVNADHPQLKYQYLWNLIVKRMVPLKTIAQHVDTEWICAFVYACKHYFKL